MISAALQERTVNFGPGSDCPNFLDPRTGEHRLFTLAAMRAVLQLARLAVVDMGRFYGLPPWEGNA